MKKLSKLYPGWWLVLATGITCFLGLGFTGMSFSIMFKPISAELGLSRAATSIASSIQNAISAVLAPLGGIGSDKYGPRRILLIGTIVAGVGCFLMYFVNSLWTFLLVWGVLIGAGMYLGFAFFTDRAIVNWFVKKSGIAINLKFAIQMIAGVTLLPFIAWLIIDHGWRIIYIIGGATIFLVCIPLVGVFVKPHRPEHYGLLPDGELRIKQDEMVGSLTGEKPADDEVREFTLKQTIRTSAFWIYVGVICVEMIPRAMMTVHLVPFLTDRGIGAVQAASMMGVMNFIHIPVRLVVGYVIDRVKTANLRFMLALGFFLQVAGFAYFMVFQDIFSVYLLLMSYGIGNGINHSVGLPLFVRFFGRKYFGTSLGLGNAIRVPFGILAPIWAGWVYDSTGNYVNFILWLVILIGVVGVSSFFMFPPKSPSGVSEATRVES